jgi:hypothetical protein
MFMADLAPTLPSEFGEAPGRASFDSLVKAIKRCQLAGRVSGAQDAVRLAVLVWTAEHGIVSLRMTKCSFPWPPLDELVNDAVSTLIGLRQPAD